MNYIQFLFHHYPERYFNVNTEKYARSYTSIPFSLIRLWEGSVSFTTSLHPIITLRQETWSHMRPPFYPWCAGECVDRNTRDMETFVLHPPPWQQLMETVLHGHNATGRWVPWDYVDINDTHFKHICRCYIYIFLAISNKPHRHIYSKVCLLNCSVYFFLWTTYFFTDHNVSCILVSSSITLFLNSVVLISWLELNWHKIWSLINLNKTQNLQNIMVC